MKTLVFIEQRNGKIKSSAFEALTLGFKIAGSAGDLSAILVGKGVSGVVAQLAGYGVDKVYVVEHDSLDKYNVLSYTQALAECVKKSGVSLVLGAATPMGKDLFARASARLDAGIITDAVEVNYGGANLSAVKPMYAGKCLAEFSFTSNTLNFLSIRPNVFAASKVNQGNATAEKLDVAISGEQKLTTMDIRKGKSEKPDLTEASLIISGGRAMASADNFKILHECAEVIGATVGASRAAVDSGYATHDMQVGQTGKTVNPNLYIACGISGSIQHMAGMRTSKVIVAINTDPEAPIFTIANYGIVGDLFKAVPMLKDELKKLVG